MKNLCEEYLEWLWLEIGDECVLETMCIESMPNYWSVCNIYECVNASMCECAEWVMNVCEEWVYATRVVLSQDFHNF